MSAANGTNNEGHGHVYARPDGVRTRCGGPAVCRECALDAVRFSTHQDGVDAKRYRWLRESWLDSTRAQLSSVTIRGIEYAFDELDAAIDAEIAGPK